MRSVAVLLWVSFVLVLRSDAFRSPYDKSLALPYGRHLRAMFSGRIPALHDIPDDLFWWHALSRNNTIECECGVFTSTDRADRWTNEGKKTVNIYPWSVSLVAPGGKYAFCGGTLINDRYVLTAASCVDGSTAAGVEVLIGTWPKAHYTNLSETDELSSDKLVRKRVHRVIIHPKYSDGHLDYNIALLRLTGPVPNYGHKDGINPVCLPTSDTEAAAFDSWNSTSLFWRFLHGDGMIVPEKRSELDSVILGKEDCKNYKYSPEWSIMPDTLVCAKMEMPEKDHPYINSWDCPGDAGSPLLVTRGHQKVQVGVDSWTACYGRPKGVGVYTRITEFLPWIKLHIKEDGRNCNK